MKPLHNERGIALLITLLVVALLTITVVEFTHSVQVDQHMARNALNSLQAALLARSGINLGEAILLHDEHPEYDSYLEDWGRIDELDSQLIVPQGMRLKVRILDESGKINVNKTRPARGVRPPQPGQPTLTADAFLRDALRRLFEANDVDVDVPDRLLEYWMADASPTPGPGQQPLQQQGQQAQQQLSSIEDFRSLEDFATTFGIPASKVQKLSRYLTALPVQALGPQGVQQTQARVNINTAPRTVLEALVNDGAKADEIMQRRQDEQPIEQKEIPGLLQGIQVNNQQVGSYIALLLGATSNYFRVFTSAVVNVNPMTGRGGIARSASMLVYRRWWGGAPTAEPPPGTPRWTLMQLDWQKEGGAALFMQQTEPEEDAGETLAGETR